MKQLCIPGICKRTAYVALSRKFWSRGPNFPGKFGPAVEIMVRSAPSASMDLSSVFCDLACLQNDKSGTKKCVTPAMTEVEMSDLQIGRCPPMACRIACIKAVRSLARCHIKPWIQSKLRGETRSLLTTRTSTSATKSTLIHK